MIQSEHQQQSAGGRGWDGMVNGALESSGVDGTVMLGGGTRPVSIPFGLQALMSALLHFVAPEAPRRLRVYTYDVHDVGAVLEVRGGRPLSALPEQLTSLSAQLGVKLNLYRIGSSSAVMLTLPPPSIGS